MDFELNEQQQQVKRMVREFAEAELKPNVMKWDEAQYFPKEIVTVNKPCGPPPARAGTP